jgi:hypothetical protein
VNYTVAFTKIPTSSSLRMQFQTGLNDEGNPNYATKSLTNVKLNAADQDVYDVGTILADLQGHTLTMIMRQDTAVLDDI